MPLHPITDLNHLSIDEFVDAVLEKERADDELDERRRYSDDEEEKEAEENFSEKVVEERSRKWQNLHGRRNFKSSPAIVSSGVGSTKLSQIERKILLKHAGLTRKKRTNLINESKDNLIRQRAGIKNSNKNIAKQVVSDLEIKKRLTK